MLVLASFATTSDRGVPLTESETGLEEVHSLPPELKKYTIQDRKVIVQQPIRTAQKPGESYDGLENAKKIDLALEGEEPRPAPTLRLI